VIITRFHKARLLYKNQKIFHVRDEYMEFEISSRVFILTAKKE
jgi:hypothetical protein